MSQSGRNSGGNNISIPVTVPNGGTSQVSFPAHTVLIGEGTAPIGNAGPGDTNSILMGQGAGADPIFGMLVAGSNITLVNGAGTITISSTGGGGATNIVFTNDGATSATTNAGALNIFGDLASGSSVIGNGAQTITISNLSATTSQKGVLQLATNAQAIAGSDTAAAVTSDDLKAKLGAQTLNGIAFGNGQSSALGWTAGGAANTVLLGNGGVPIFGTVPNAALTNSTVTLNSGNNITVTGGGPLSLGGIASFNVTGTTNHAVLLGNATGSINSAALGTNGQLLIGSTGADPAFGTLTSTDSSITFTIGAGTLNLAVTGGTTVGKTITGNSGGALSPTGGNWNIVGNATQGVSTSGAASTLTVTVASATTTQIGVSELATQTESEFNTYGTTQVVQSGEITHMMAKPAPIGSSTPNTGAFTTLSSTGGQTFSASLDTFPVTSITALSDGFSSPNTSLRMFMNASIPGSIVGGFGNSMDLFAQTTDGTSQNQVGWRGEWTVTTPGAETSKGVIRTRTAGANVDSLTLFSDRTELLAGTRLRLGTGGVDFLSGTGDPNGAIAAAKGSLYMRLDGSSTTTRAYINTNSGTVWTNLVTGA